MTRRPWLASFAVAALSLAASIGYLASGEVPTGMIKGKVLAEDTGRPLPNATIQMHGQSPAPGKSGEVVVFHSRPDGTFKARRIPAGMYAVEASTRAHALHHTMVSINEGEVRDLQLELPPVPPFLDLRMPQHVYLPDETPQVSAHGFIQEDELTFRLYRVDTKELFAKHGGNLSYLLHQEGAPRTEPGVPKNIPGLTPAGSFTAPIKQRDVEGVFHQRINVPVQAPGLYVVEAVSEPTHRMTWVMVTRLGLVVKHARGEALAYVADLKTGAPVSGATVELAPQGKGPAATGTTDAEGIFRARLSTATGATGEGDEEGGSSTDVTAWAEKDGSQAFLTYYEWSGGNERYRVYSYTDRPVYRPGHQTSFNGIARVVQDVGYGVPANKPVEVEIRDPRDTVVYRQTLTTDRYGSFHGALSLSDEAATGYYTLRTRLGGEETESGFKVAEYRKPEYEVAVKTGKTRYTRGETIDARVSAQYYFGAPVADAEVTYQVMRAPYYYYPDMEEEAASEGGDSGDGEGYDGEDGGEYYDSGEVVSEGKAHTDAQGVAHLSIPTRRSFVLGQKQTQQPDEDQDERYVISVTVRDVSEREVTGEAATIVTQGEFALRANPTSYVSEPGKATDIALTAQTYEGKPVPGAAVKVVVQRETFGGRSVNYSTAAELSATTDARGAARVTFTPRQAGYYRIEATTHDARGNRIRTRNYLWVPSEEYSDFGIQYPDLEIIPDKREYRKGDTATVLINTQHAGGTALLTLEGPKVFSHQLIQLKGKSTRVTVPITPEYVPNVYVAVALVRDKQFATQERRLLVSVADRKLQVAVQPNKTRYAPGERATYTLLTRNAAGQPVPAMASLGVVDESIYAIQSEMVPSINRFFYQPRGNSVQTSYSFPSFYLDANKEPVGIKVRRKFIDTAYWNPTVITGADGRATISFVMPDTLTTWRATTRAATLDTEVGESVMKVQTAKDLLVRLEMPRFFTQNDRLTIAAVVHSYAKARQEVKLWIRAPGLTFNGSKQPPRMEEFSLDPSQVHRQEWQIEVPTAGPKEVTVYAKAASGLSDAMALTIPAMPHGREQVEARSGIVTDTGVERLSVRTDAVAGAGELRVRMTPSLAGVMFGALDYLAAYPYGCTEQTMSAFLPDVVVAHALRELKLSNPKLEKKLPDMVRRGFDRLYSYQHDDGGWGWWRYDQSDAWMTAYVVYGLLLAKSNGFAVNETALDNGLTRLAIFTRQPKPLDPQTRAFATQVLAMAGQRDVATPLVNDLYAKSYGLDTVTLARLTAALLALDRGSEAKQVANLLWPRASQSGTLLWWPSGTRTYWGHEGTSDVEVTALVFSSLQTLFPDDPRLGNVVRWLILNRQGDCWESTRGTAFVLYAITDYVRRSHELTPDYQAKVLLGDRVLLDRRVTTADVYAPEVEVRVPFSELRRGTNVVRLTKAGQGNLYYSATLTQYLYQEDMTALVSTAGLTITRQYFRMRTGRASQGSGLSSLAEPDPSTSFAPRETVLARITVEAPRAYEYMVIEDPLPSGAEAQDRGAMEMWEWNWWYSDMQVRDEKVSFFARYLPKGRSTMEYYLSPQFPGEYHVMPTVAYNMYAPEVRGTGAETRVTIR